MRSLINFKKIIHSLPFIGTAILSIGCQPDKIEEGLAPDTPLQASFTVSPVQGRSNRYLITNTTPGAIACRWDIGNGTGWSMGKMADTVFYPDAGTYSIKMQALNKAGVLYDAAQQTINVTTSDPNSGNLIAGGKMETGDESKWTKLTISSGVSWTMNDGKMTATGGGWGHAAIYQPIQVEANKKYRFSMLVSGSGASDTWFEVYFGTATPVQGSDYSSGGNKIGINTWTGCGKTAFKDNINTVGCTGDILGKNGEITFNQSGTLYLVIKTGGGNLGTEGISVDNIELRGI
jgi:hypothetical protein